MKWITPLWSDPIGWSDAIAKTKLRVLIATLFHIAVVALGLFMQKFDIIAGSSFIALFGVVLPCYYLCAMHQLLSIAKQKETSKLDP